MACSSFCEKWHSNVEGLFERYGGFVSRYPVIILTITVIVNCILGIGLFWIDMETDFETLYTPINSRAFQDRKKMKAMYNLNEDSFYEKGLIESPCYADVILKTKDDSNILSTKHITQMKNIHTEIKSKIIIWKNSSMELAYENVCAARNGQCVVQGEFIFTPEFRVMMLSKNITYPWFDGALLPLVFGSAQFSNGILTFATSVRLVYYLKSNTNNTKALSGKWEKAFIEAMSSKQLDSFDTSYSVSTSMQDGIDSAVQDIIYFSSTLVIMLLYASFATSGGNCVSQRQNLGRAGVVTTLLAFLGSFGFVSAIGVKFSDILGFTPFLIIGIGIDDMFILMSGLSSAPAHASIEDKIRHTMKTSGVAITITSLTDVLAFAIGYSSAFFSVQIFCVYTGVAVMFCYLNQLFFFLPCMVINERRVENNRHCGTCLIIPSRKNLHEEDKEGRECYYWCCTGDPPTKREDNESPLEKYPKSLLKIIVSSVPCKITIGIVYIVYIVTSIYGVLHLEEGLVFRNLINKDSYYYKYSYWFDTYFDDTVIVTFTIDSQYEYSRSTTQHAISIIIDKSVQDPEIEKNLVFNWLTDYKTSQFYQNSSEVNFISGLQQFLIIRPDYRDDVLIDENNTKVKSSRLYVVSKHLASNSMKGNFMKRMRNIADSVDISCFAYAPAFVLFEQYLIILPNTLQTAGIAIAAMFVVTCIFIPHPFFVFLVVSSMLTILLGLFGFMYYWDLTLSSLTMVMLIMSIGISVDYSAHICHGYISGGEMERKDRVSGALDRTGGPIFNAFMSSFLGILILTASSSYVLATFFKLMFLVITFGFFHSLCFIPVVLSLVGPIANSNNKDNKDVMNKNPTIDILSSKPQTYRLYDGHSIYLIRI